MRLLGVRFRHEKLRTHCETGWVFSPSLTEHLERSSAVQSLEIPGKVGSHHESQNVGFQRIKTQVMKRLNRSSYNRTIHSLDLAAIPRMVRLG